MPRAARLARLALRALRALAAAGAILAVILVANTLRVAPPPRPSPPPLPAHAVPADVIARHLAAALRVDTVSHEDPAQDDPSKLVALRALLEATYPRVHAALAREIVGGGALLYTWKGSDPGMLPALFAAHMDVVPVEPGTEGAWERPPFSGAIEGGFVWGRGAVDDKLSLIGLLEAAESLLAEGFAPRRTIMLAFGGDEEVGGERGAKVIAEELARRGVKLDYALDEGMAVTEGIVPDMTRPVAPIGLGEKGFATLALTVEMEGGHSSMPPAETSIGVLAGAVEKLARAPMPARLTEVSRLSLAALAPYMPFGKRVAIANLWLTEPLVLAAMAKQPVSDASIRTTTAPTVFHAGVKDNVLPAKARAAVNFRILPGDTTESVVDHARRVIADPRVQIRVTDALRGDPPPLASTDTPAYRLLEATIQRFYPEAVVVPGLVLGATDGRHYKAVAANVYRFAPFVVRGGRDRERVHGTNERVAIRDLETAVSIYRALMKDGRAE